MPDFLALVVTAITLVAVATLYGLGFLVLGYRLGVGDRPPPVTHTVVQVVPSCRVKEPKPPFEGHVFKRRPPEAVTRQKPVTLKELGLGD